MLNQKAKYVAVGALGAMVIVPLALRALDVLPVTFKSGDILSAEVINALFGRVETTLSGYSSKSELNGTWNCIGYTFNSNGPQPFPLSQTTGTVIFNSSNGTYVYTGGQNALFGYLYYTQNANQNIAISSISGQYDMGAGSLFLSFDVGGGISAYLSRPSPKIFQSDMGQYGTTSCAKMDVAPLPPNGVTVAVSSRNVTISWTGQDASATGFKVQRKLATGTTWTNVTTTSSSTTSYLDVLSMAGDYHYRVLATNSYGDSITSSEVDAVVQ